MPLKKFLSLLLVVAFATGFFDSVSAKPKAMNLAKRKTFTMQELLAMTGSKNFIVPVKAGNVPLKSTEYTANGVAQITGSASVSEVGLQGVVAAAMQSKTAIMLSEDPILIEQLRKVGSFGSDVTLEKYKKILLYFETGGYRFYLVDPWPGRAVRSAMGGSSRADQIIDNWDLSDVQDSINTELSKRRATPVTAAVAATPSVASAKAAAPNTPAAVAAVVKPTTTTAKATTKPKPATTAKPLTTSAKKTTTKKK